MPRYRRKPAEIDAIRYTGENEAEIGAMIGVQPMKLVAGRLFAHVEGQGAITADIGDMVALNRQSQRVEVFKPGVFDHVYEQVSE